MGRYLARILQVQVIGIYDNFFDLGGHSLKATRIVSKIHKELGIEIRLRDMFVISHNCRFI
ncbi:MAG: hypothetical protein HC887_09480 [Desulfobacteraceae bacterium]|nr:hypothetical protein [Desulfobacteraceae bacterium]